MISYIDRQFINFNEQLSEIFSNMKDSLVPACLSFKNDWQMDIMKDDKFKEILERTGRVFKRIRPKINRKSKKCIFFGETSSGKSSLINVIIQRDVLPEAFGSVSTCFVEIRSIPLHRLDRRSYLVVDGEEREITLLAQLNNSQSTNSLPFGSHIDLFHDLGNPSIFINDVVFTDTPGFDNNKNTDELVEEYCNDADLIIMVVNSTSWINNSIRIFIDRLKQCMTELNLIIVFNFWDIPDNRHNSDIVKSQLRDAARDIICEKLRYSVEEANARIHFLSAYERFLFNTNANGLLSIQGWQSRNEAFDRFITFLKAQMDETPIERRYNYLCQLKAELTSIFNKCRPTVSEISDTIDKHSKHITDKFSDISELKNEIKTSTSSIFQAASEKYIEDALDIMKSYEKSDQNNEYKHLIEVNYKLEVSLAEIIKKSKEDIKRKIKACIMRTNDEYLTERIFIVENIYFPQYIDVMTIDFDEELVEMFQNIRRKINLTWTIVIEFASILTKGVVAGIGALGALLGSASSSAAVGAVVIGSAGTETGGGIAIAKNRIDKAIKAPFKWTWNNDAILIRSKFKNIGDDVSDSYRRFLDDIDKNLQKNYKALKEELDQIQNRFDIVNDEIKQFHNRFLLL